MEAAVIWVIIGVALAVAEVFTLTFVLLMFGAGALVAAIPAMLGAPGWVQVLVFVNRPTTNAKTAEPTIFRDQVRMTMVKSGDEWLVDLEGPHRGAVGCPPVKR